MSVLAWGRRFPPENCPVCRGRVWSIQDTRSIVAAWRLYNQHVHASHPEYERWNRRMSLNYFVTIIIALVGPAIVFQVASVDVARPFIVLFWILAVVVGVMILVAHRRGRRRFRDLWNQEHGGPINPQ
jgi:hypothetical protein